MNDMVAWLKAFDGILRESCEPYEYILQGWSFSSWLMIKKREGSFVSAVVVEVEDYLFDLEPLHEHFSEVRKVHCLQSNACFLQHLALVCWNVFFCLENEGPGYGTTLSSLELTFGVVQTGMPFPFRDPSTQGWRFCHFDDKFEIPKLSFLLKTVRGSILGRLSFLGLDHLVVQGIDKTGIGICTPKDGLVVQVSDRFSKSVQEPVLQFTARRPLRRACDYARPCH